MTLALQHTRFIVTRPRRLRDEDFTRLKRRLQQLDIAYNKGKTAYHAMNYGPLYCSNKNINNFLSSLTLIAQERAYINHILDQQHKHYNI